jgi:hypothetical protein
MKCFMSHMVFYTTLQLFHKKCHTGLSDV